MNTDNIPTPRAIARAPQQARKSYLNVFEQDNTEETNQDRIDDPSDFGPATLIADNYNGRPKNNGPNQEMNTDDFRTPTTFVRVPKKARKRNLGVFGQHNADQANQDRVGDFSVLGPTALISDNYNGRPKNKRPMYDLDLLIRKRIILSNDVTKTTLVKHDERSNESNNERDVEDDETFFENLKKRINKDLQKNILHNTPNPSPKRLPKARKCKSLLNNETRSLMNKFRNEFANIQSQKLLSQENGVFSMARRSNSVTPEEHPHSMVPQRAVERGMTEDSMLQQHETHDNSLHDTLSFHETHADGYNHPPTPPSMERMVSMERRSNSWTGENVSEHPHSATSQNVVRRRMTNDISMKYLGSDEDSPRGRSPFNEIHVETHNNYQPTPSSSERSGAFSMERRSSSWTRGNIREHPRSAMSQSGREYKSMKNILWGHCGTDEDSLRNTLTFNEFDAEPYNCQPTPSSSERNGAFLMGRRSNNSTRECIYEHPHPAMAQKVVERRPTKDIMLDYFEFDKDSLRGTPSFNEIHTEAYKHQPMSSSTASNTFLKHYTTKYY